MFTTAKLQHFDSYLMIITYFLLLDFSLLSIRNYFTRYSWQSESKIVCFSFVLIFFVFFSLSPDIGLRLILSCAHVGRNCFLS